MRQTDRLAASENFVPPEECPCKRVKCERHANCTACIAYHEGHRHPPACMKKKRK